MCLAVPGRIIAVTDDRGVPMATVDFDGIRKEVCLAFLPDVGVGDYTLVHVGFAISHIDEAAALESLALFRAMGALEDELDTPTETEAAG
jgi:hydrogenase expression/formation protein HypC